MLYTTLAAIRAHSPCQSGWTRLLGHLGKTKADDEPLALSVVLESNGVADALWCLRACDGAEIFARRFALDMAKRVYPIWHAKHSKDACVKNCIAMTGMYLRGKATKEELIEARYAATDATVRVFGRQSADAAYAAYAAYAAAATDATDAATYAALVARAADAAAAERKWQARHLAACLRAWPKKPWPKVTAIKMG